MSCAPQPRPTAQPPWCIATARPSRCSHASQVHHMRMRVLASSLWHGKRPRQSSGMLRSTGQGQRRGVPRCRHITHGTRPNLVGLDKMDPSVPTANEVLPCNCGGDGGCGDGGRGGGADSRVRGAIFFFSSPPKTCRICQVGPLGQPVGGRRSHTPDTSKFDRVANPGGGMLHVELFFLIWTLRMTNSSGTFSQMRRRGA